MLLAIMATSNTETLTAINNRQQASNCYRLQATVILYKQQHNSYFYWLYETRHNFANYKQQEDLFLQTTNNKNTYFY